MSRWSGRHSARQPCRHPGQCLLLEYSPKDVMSREGRARTLGRTSERAGKARNYTLEMQNADVECVECQESKREAQEKAAARSSGGLQLGDCAPLYRDWADCVEQSAGKAQACKTVLEKFRACHQQRSVAVPQR